MAKAGDITIGVQADFARFRDDMGKLGGVIKSSVGEMQTSLHGINEGFELAKHAVEGFMVALGVEKLVEFVKGTAEAALQLQVAAQVAGLSTTAYQELLDAAEHVGVTHEAMTSGLDKFTKSIGLAADGNKQSADAFKALGVSVLYADGTIRPTEDLFNQVATAISEIASPAERARLEVALFGRAGQQLAPLLNEGGEGVRALREETEKMGLVMSEDTIAKLANVQIQIDELTQHWRVFTAHLLAEATPALIGFIDTLNNLITVTTEHASRSAIETRQMDLLNRAIKAQEETLASDLKKMNDPGWLQALQPWKDWPAIIAADRAELKKLQDQLDALGVSMPGAGIPGASLHPMHGGHASTGDPVTTAKEPTAHTTGKSQAEKDAEAYATVTQRLKDEILALQGHEEQLKLDTALREAHAKAGSVEADVIQEQVTQYFALKKSKEDDAKLTQEAKSLLDKYQPANDKYLDDLKELNRLYDLQKISMTQLVTATMQLREEQAKADPTTKKLAEDQKEFQSAVEDAAGALLTDLGRAFTDSGTAADRWKNFVTHAIQDVMNVLDGLLKKVLGGALDSLFGGAGGATLGSILGFGNGAVLGPLAGSPALMASGGHMGTGDWAIVGEAGPELVFADTPGNVLSADRTRGIFGGTPGGDTHFHIDARGADMGAVARMEIALRDFHRTFDQRAVAAVASQRKRGGTFASTFNR